MSETEFSRVIDRRSITEAPVKLTATQEECAALAKRFAIVSIARLEASVMLLEEGDAVHAKGTLSADILQSCAISGDDLPARINEEFALRFVPEAEWADLDAEEVELDEDDLDALAYDGSTFDLGEAVAQSLALAIDPYATGPDADRTRDAAGISGDDAPSGPLADALASLRKDS